MGRELRREKGTETPPTSPATGMWERIPAEQLVDGFTRLRSGIDWPYTGLFDPIPCLIQSSSDFMPPVDLYETDTEVVLNTDLPGMSPEDLEVEARGDILYLTGVYRADGGSRFDPRVRLPVEIDAGRVTATYRKGTLEVRMPMVKAVPLRPVTIPVEMEAWDLAEPSPGVKQRRPWGKFL